jgi:hypothetical protein
MSELQKYEVRLVVRDAEGRIDHMWSMTFHAENYGHAEEQALIVLADNEDKESKIERIELW